MKIYLACSFAYKNPDVKADRIQTINKAAQILRDRGFEVYVPHEHKLNNAWSLSNYQWATRIAGLDLTAINNSDWVVLLTYGKERNNAGVSCECGYAYAKGKKVLLVKMNEDIESMMMWTCSLHQVRGIDVLKDYDFDAYDFVQLENVELS